MQRVFRFLGGFMTGVYGRQAKTQRLPTWVSTDAAKR
jgi:hypothetical protein